MQTKYTEYGDQIHRKFRPNTQTIQTKYSEDSVEIHRIFRLNTHIIHTNHTDYSDTIHRIQSQNHTGHDDKRTHLSETYLFTDIVKTKLRKGHLKNIMLY